MQEGRDDYKGKVPDPIVLTFLACDDVITDAATQKKTIVGCFGDIFAVSYPVLYHRLALFAELTNGHGDSQI